MKPLTVTTIVALILAIPFVFKAGRTVINTVRVNHNPAWTNPDKMYDVDDFLT